MTALTDHALNLIIGAISLAVAALRWTTRRRSGKPSLPSRLWRWWIMVSDRERVILDQQTDNERLIWRISVQNSLIKTLQDDIDLASGIASSRELHNGEAHHWPSGEPMTHSHPLSSTTTGAPGLPEERNSMLSRGERRAERDRRRGWGRIGVSE